jgi:DNA-binding NarL/FixJ family response regulator
MIRTLVVDDHPTVRVGLVSVLKSEPGIVPVSAAEGVQEAMAETKRSSPDVALIDYQLRDGDDGLVLGLDLKRLPDPPRVIIYSAHPRSELAVGATLIGADALLDKGAPVDEIFETVRAVVGGERRLPQLSPDMLAAAGAALDREDLPLFSMALAGEAVDEMASIVAAGGVEETVGRLRSIVVRLGPRGEAKAGETYVPR